MEKISQTKIYEAESAELSKQSSQELVEANKISSAVLKRLIEEVKYDSQNNISVYNRTHSRHNRGR